MSNVEICQVAYEGRISRLKALLETNPKLISVADQVILKICCASAFCSLGGARDLILAADLEVLFLLTVWAR